VLEAKIVVQAGRGVLLDDEARILGGADPAAAARLRGLLEIALGLVGRKLLLLHHRCPLR
jgi:hypothetical protein